MKKQSRGFTGLSVMLHLKKNELLEMLHISRPHAHMIDRGERSMPSEAGLIAGTLQLALAKSGAYEKSPVSYAPIARKEAEDRIKELNYKIVTVSRRVERLTLADQNRLSALAAFKVWEFEPMLPKSRREALTMWKKYHIRRLESMNSSLELAEAKARLAGLKAEAAYWDNTSNTI